jgi:type IV secretion system protein TrbL
MDALIDQITAAFLGALQTGGKALAHYSLPLLTILGIIQYYRTHGVRVLVGAGSLSDALASPLLFAITFGMYYYVLFHIFDLSQSALQTVFQWGLEASGNPANLQANMQKPSFIMGVGMQAAAPVAAFSNWWDSMASIVKLGSSPLHLWAFMVILAAFLGLTLHHMAMLIEYQLAVLCGTVLIPWGIWEATAQVAEFAVGWLLGAVIRALVSTTMLGIALPLFVLLTPTPAVNWSLANMVIPQALPLAIGAFIFAVLAWFIPARAASIAGRGISLALHGGTFMSAATGVARFGMMAQGAVRGFSRLIGG